MGIRLTSFRWLRLATCAGAGVLLACGQSGGSGSQACAPGRSLECVGPGECSGYQVCVADGTGFGPCECDRSSEGGLDATIRDATIPDATMREASASEGGQADGAEPDVIDSSFSGSDAPGDVVSCTNPFQSLCDGACVYLVVDPNNCGVCGHVCPGQTTCTHAGSGCDSFGCCCPTGILRCNDACVMNDPNNCGRCGVICSGATPNCIGGYCQ